MSSASTLRPEPKHMRNPYYTILTATLLVLGVVAFLDNLVTDVGQPSNQQPETVVHGIFALAWMVLIVVQANYIRIGSFGTHRKLGPVVFATAAGLVVSTAYLFYVGFAGFDAMSPPVLANRIMLPLFAAALVLAWYLRRLAAWHKRLIILGTLLTLSPVLSRSVDRILGWIIPGRTESTVDMIFTLSFAGLWTALFISHWIYDYKVIRRIHPLTVSATVALYGVYAFAYFF